MTKIIDKEINDCVECMFHDECEFCTYGDSERPFAVDEVEPFPSWCPLPNKEEAKS